MDPEQKLIWTNEPRAKVNQDGNKMVEKNLGQTDPDSGIVENAHTGLYPGILGKGPWPNWGKKNVHKMFKLGKKY